MSDEEFETCTGLERNNTLIGGEWDDDECYFVVDELMKFIPRVKYEKYSFCAGLLSIKG